MPILINKATVRRSLEQWFIAARAGETLSARESAALSAHDAAAMSSDYFYDLLCADEDAAHPSADEPVTLIAAEDIAAGQLLVVDAEGKVTGYVGETTVESADEFFG